MCNMLDGNSFAEWTPTPCKQTIAQETGAALPNFIWFLFLFSSIRSHSFTKKEWKANSLCVDIWARWELSLSQPPSRLISSPQQLLLLAILKTFMAIWLSAFLILTLIWYDLILVSHSNFLFIFDLWICQISCRDPESVHPAATLSVLKTELSDPILRMPSFNLLSPTQATAQCVLWICASYCKM